MIAFAVPFVAAWFPRSWWSQALFSSHGPRLDAENMVRSECLRASLGFFLIGALGLGTSLLLVWAGDWLFGSFDRQVSITLLMFVYAIVGMVGVSGGLYLLLRAPFRPSARPETLQITFLKEYVSPDGQRRASLWESPDGTLVVLEHAHTSHSAETSAAWDAPVVSAKSLALPDAEALALRIIGQGGASSVEDA